MPSSKHKKSRTARGSINHPTPSHADVPTLQKLTISFEESQFLCLQNMIDKLAAKILDSLNGDENQDPSAILPQLRIYTQYMNLYMKFKEKCITSETLSPQQPMPKKDSAQSVHQQHPSNTAGKSSPSAHFGSPNRSNPKPEANRMPHVNSTTALLMQPASGT